MSGTLYLVGVGTGDPELLTLKAARVLGEIKVVAYGQKTNQSSRALEIAQGFLHPKVKYLPIDIPMQTQRKPAQTAYDNLAKHIQAKLNIGQDIAYICEGDPLFYASAMYLIERMDKNTNIEIISGITSPLAASAAIKRPLCARNEMLKILPATLNDAALIKELENAPSAAIMKVGRHFNRIKNILEKTAHANGAMIVENASCENQRIIKLNDYPKDELPYFAIILCYKGDENWGK